MLMLAWPQNPSPPRHTAANIPLNVFSEKELRGLSPSFHIHVSVSDLYITWIGPHIFMKQNRGSWEYSSLQTNKSGNWDCGHAIPFPGMFLSNFRYCIFAV
jgi:hypothetical protein